MSNEIVNHIGVPALLEQTAEECCELAQACLKMARKLRDENPTPKSIEDIHENLIEEMADVMVCIGCIADAKTVDIRVVLNKSDEKEERWQERLGLSIDLEEPCETKSDES